MTSTALFLFRRDLRLGDNPALSAACDQHDVVVPVYMHHNDGRSQGEGAASRWWLHQSLAALQASLRAQGGSLHLCQDNSAHSLCALLRHCGATTVYWNRRYEPAAILQDTELQRILSDQGIEVRSFSASLWSEPWTLCTQKGEPYRVFTPYWRKLRSQLICDAPLPDARPRRWFAAPADVPLALLKLLPSIRWDSGLHQAWTPGEEGAHDLLRRFCNEALQDYARARDVPARQGTSRLSPHLHFGEMSPRQIHFALNTRALQLDGTRQPDLEPYLRQLGWREFAYHLLYHFPKTPTENFNARFDSFQWAPHNGTFMQRWQQGRTGIPLVDAGMRELWHTGWMHNRVRMIVASFLTKNLRQHWQDGAGWFRDTLVDADLANNTLGWQWVAGSGADAAPYFRIFNPVTQAKKFDPDGVYLRHWLPELASASTPILHEPWKDAALLARSGYPAPIIDLAVSRQAALAAYQESRLTPRQSD